MDDERISVGRAICSDCELVAMISRTQRRIVITGTALFVCGIIIGAGGMSIATRTSLVPQLLTANHLQFGVAEDGKPALCDDEGIAYRLFGGVGVASLGIAVRDAGLAQDGIPRLEAMSCQVTATYGRL